MPRDPIYLDNNATTALLPEVVEAMRGCDEAAYMNPASQHWAGRRARQRLEEARDTVARVLGLRTTPTADRVIFTSGGTEANNLALLGLAGRRPGRVLISPLEHPSVLKPAEELRRRGFDVQMLPVSEEGVVAADEVPRLLTVDTRLVSVMLANNETGVLQRVPEIARLCDEAGVPLHTDAVQVVGKSAVDFSSLGVTALSCTAHKFHGPRGIGALILRADVPLDPLIYGGFQQQGLRPGTESVALAVGFARALELWEAEGAVRAARIGSLRDRFEQRLCADPAIVVNGGSAPRLPHTSNLSFLGCERQALWMALDVAGVACSTGSACASGSSEPSSVLSAMGLEPERIASALRFSLSALTTQREVDEACDLILTAINDLRRLHQRRKMADASRKQRPKSL